MNRSASLFIALALAAGPGGLAAGCTNGKTADLMQRQMEQLDRELREVRGSMSGMEGQMEEMQGQMVLLEDRVRLTQRQPAPAAVRPFPDPLAAPQYASNGYSGVPGYGAAPGYDSAPSQGLAPAPRPRSLPIVRLSPDGYATNASDAAVAQRRSEPSLRAPRGGGSALPTVPDEAVDAVAWHTIDADGVVRSTDGAEAIRDRPILRADDAMDGVVPAGPPAPSLARSPSGAESGGAGDPKAAYEAAFSRFRDGDLDAAEGLFLAFVNDHPRTDLTDNALYWWAECRYHRRDYLQALQLFGRILDEHPRANKVPDAMVKMGLSLINLGQRGEGIKLLRQVVRSHADTPSAKVAQRSLSEHGSASP